MTQPSSRRLLVVAIVMLGVALATGPVGRMLVALLVLLFAPGYMLGRWLAPADQPMLVRLALYLGLSLSCWPLLYQWLTTFGLALPTPLLALLVSLLALASAAMLWRDAAQPAASQPEPGPRWAYPALLAICGLVLWARFAEIENLALPAWVDSVHHGLMVRVAAERGQAPLNLTPYLPVVELPYHWGYHVIIGAAMQLSGLRVDHMLLWSGQILNALHAPAAGALALALWRKPLAALVAALVVGLVSTMPAYYVSWGRYTQLTGLLMLPALVICWQAALEHNRRNSWIAAALVLAGLSLVHFRVLVFSLALLAVLSLLWAVKHGMALTLARLRAAVLCALLALALAAPWLWIIGKRTLLPALGRPQNLIIEGGYNNLRPEVLWVGQNRLLISLALLAALWGCWQRKLIAMALLSWVAILVIMASPILLTYLAPAVGVLLLLKGFETVSPQSSPPASKIIRLVTYLLLGLGLVLINPWLVRIPAIYLITFDAVLISLFIPLGLLIGGGAAALYDRLVRAVGTPRRWLVELGTILIISGVAIGGGNALRDVLNPATVIASQADLAAVEWAAQNTPPDARFLLNVKPWIGATDRGVDGGWWLLTLTGRWMSTPPALFIYGSQAYIAEVQSRNRTVINYKAGNEQAIRELLARDQINYLFFGSEPGPLKAETFASLPGFTTVYNKDGVTILAVDQ
jgi:hypothetical protein